MECEEIESILSAGLNHCRVLVNGDGTHFEAICIGACFENKSKLERHRMVYALIGDEIASGALHALSIKAYTESEYQQI